MTASRRLLLALLLVLLLGAGATPALAGEYPVYACEPTRGDVNRSWTAERNHGGVVAYTRCPTGAGDPSWNRGLVARSVTVPSNPHATIPQGSRAAMVFRAPPGATLSRISYTHDLCGGSGFRAGLHNAAGQWLRYAGPRWCGLWFGPTETIGLGGTTALRIMTQCLEGPCLVGTVKPGGYAAFRSATVVVSDRSAPSVTLAGGSALAPRWLRGRVDVAVRASDNVGVRYADVLLDGGRQAAVDTRCDYTRIVPCPSVSTALGANTRVVPDGRRTLVVRARDTAGNWRTSSRPVWVDNTAPTSPRDVALVAGEGWRQRNRFALRWTNPRQAGKAPIAGVRTAICPAGNAPERWDGCTYRDVAERDVTAISDLRVPDPGEWEARLWLRDAAGNADATTAQRVRLRFDDVPPSLAFAAPNPNDPGRVDVRASDTTSGLRRTELEIRRQGNAAWVALPTRPSATGFYAHMDDEHLADGVYLLRARAHDGAGNERSTDRGPSGAPVTRTVPLRIDTTLKAGQLKHVRAKRSRGGKRRTRRVIVVRPTVRYGRTIPIRGRLTTPGGNPVASATIDVWERIARPAATWRRVAVIGTDTDGRFRFKALRGPSRTLRFRYPGTALVRARTREVEIRVQAGTSMRASRGRVVNGDEVVFRGRVKGRPLPPTGKLIQLQVRSRGRWLTFATPRASSKSGRWRHRYRFTATRGTVRYRFRARLPRESGYPYDDGVSRRVRVVVRGL